MWDKDKKETGARPMSESTPTTVTPVYHSPDPVKSTRAANIGASILIKGELQGDEDLIIDGRVEGKIDLREHNLTIGPNGKIKADLYARTIVVSGEVTGSAFAAERVEIAPSGRLMGDITSPRITIADGAHFKGSVDMDRGGQTSTTRTASTKETVRSLPDPREEAAKSHPRL
jgi:cytoskeletal protein CcmA (bactofilin family)